MSESLRCAVPGCVIDACTVLRITPRRTDTPLCDPIRRALVWPGVNLPCDVPVCSRRPCQEAVRQAAQNVLAETVLGDGVTVRVVKEDGA